MNETERIAAMLRGLDCPHADDDYNICRACATEAAETIDAQAATIAHLQSGIQQIRAGYLESHLMLMAERDKALAELRSSMSEPERIAKLFDRAVADGAFAGPLPFGPDVFVDAAKYLRQLDAQAATIAEHPGNQAIAERIAEEFFVNGSGQEAYRLVLTSRDGRDLGGWGKGPLTDRIVGVLAGVTEGK